MVEHKNIFPGINSQGTLGSEIRPSLEALICASIQESFQVKQAVLDLVPNIVEVAEQMLTSLQQGGKIILMGNGGSAADAQHIAAELMGRFEQERKPWPAIALTTDTSILTALVNDYGAEEIFARQIEGLGQTGDLVIAISTSGNSPNILAGVKAARAKAIDVIGLTGKGGGQLAQLCSVTLQVPSHRTARIQEAHTMVGHLLCEAIDATSANTDLPHKCNPVEPQGPQQNQSFDLRLLAQIKLLILDFDGVLTDNRVLVDQHGTESVWCHRGDGWGIARLKETGLEILVLSTETNPVVMARCQKMGLDCIHGCQDKPSALRLLVEERNLELHKVAYVGNDVNDLACMAQVGVAIAPADAVPEIRKIAHITTTQNGGYGAVREIADLLLQAKYPQQRGCNTI